MASPSLTTSKEVIKLLGAINPNNSGGFDNIPRKLVKLAAEILANPLLHLMSCILKGYGKKIKRSFSKSCQIAIVSPLYKGGLDKSPIVNYRPVTISTTFSEIYEQVTKD